MCKHDDPLPSCENRILYSLQCSLWQIVVDHSVVVFTCTICVYNKTTLGTGPCREVDLF